MYKGFVGVSVGSVGKKQKLFFLWTKYAESSKPLYKNPCLKVFGGGPVLRNVKIDEVKKRGQNST